MSYEGSSAARCATPMPSAWKGPWPRIWWPRVSRSWETPTRSYRRTGITSRTWPAGKNPVFVQPSAPAWACSKLSWPGGSDQVSGEVAFRLHDTHGFPIELTREIASERGAGVDEAGFEAAMGRQRAMSKQAGMGKKANTEELLDLYRSVVEDDGPTRFVGYTEEAATSTVLAAAQREDGHLEIFLDRTPFYAEGGGQVGDTGVIETDTGRARVIDTTYALPGLIRHLAFLEEGGIHRGQVAAAAIDSDRRAAIRRNHTGTHLLHWALRRVLGDHVKQQGSLVDPDRLRFDFTHYSPVSREETERIEDLVNAADPG